MDLPVLSELAVQDLAQIGGEQGARPKTPELVTLFSTPTEILVP